MTQYSEFALNVAKSIAARKKVPTDQLEAWLTEYSRDNNMTTLIAECGATAARHGFWHAHVQQACETAGVPYELYMHWLLLKHGEEVPPPNMQPELTPEMSTKCEVIRALHDKRLLGDPFIFLGLVGTEVAEAMESCRKGNWTEPDGVYEELADAVIRIFDFVCRFVPPGQQQKIAIEQFVEIIRAKMAVNESRPYLHGKKF